MTCRWPPHRRAPGARARRVVRCRRLVAAVLAGLVTSALVGCVSIPRQGPVVDGGRVESGPGGVLQLLVAGPSSDATPEGLIRDFLRAEAVFTNDHETARSFLVPDRRVDWRADSPVVVYAGSDVLTLSVTRGGVTQVYGAGATPSPTAKPNSGKPTAGKPSAAKPNPGKPTAGQPSAARATTTRPSPARPTAAGTPGHTDPSAPPVPGEIAQVRLRTPVEARVDSRGQYTISPPGDVEERRFELVGTDRGWRIRSLDPGILITRSDFGFAFRDLPLYFADPTGSYLVPDVRWFPVSDYGSSAPSSLVAALLVGPARWLGPAVTTGAPRGTQPTINAVRVQDGVATVDLSAAARTADSHQRQILKSQLEQTLASLAQLSITINRVDVTVEQQRFDLQPAPTRTDVSKIQEDETTGLRPPPDVDDRPVVIDSKGRVARLSGSVAMPVPGLGGLTSPSASAPATDAGGQSFAVLLAGRSRLVAAVPSGRPEVLLRGRNLTPPSYDPFGYIWTAQSAFPGTLYAIKPGMSPVLVQVPWLSGMQLTSLRISREGARAILVAQRPGGAPLVYVCGVVRSAQGAPTALTTPVRLLPDATAAAGAAWVDADHVVVLARRPGSTEQPWIVEIGGDVESTLPVQGVWVTAGNSESDLYVQTASGAVLTRLGLGWSSVPGVRWPSMAG